MPPRTLATLAHALSVAPDVDAALLALADALAEVDRFAQIALVRFDARREMLVDRLAPNGDAVARTRLETTFDHLPTRERIAVAAGGHASSTSATTPTSSPRCSRCKRFSDVGWLSLRGLRFEGQLVGDPRALRDAKVLRHADRRSGSRPPSRCSSSPIVRFLEREAREEAVRTLEDVTQRVHGEYERKLGTLEQQLLKAAGAAVAQADPERLVALEREAAQALEDARRANRRADAVEATGARGRRAAREGAHRAASPERVAPSEDAHALPDRPRAHARRDDGRSARDGERAAHARRRRHGRAALLAAAARAGGAARSTSPRRAASRRTCPPGTASSSARAWQARWRRRASRCSCRTSPRRRSHPLLRDEYFTTGSFISFPLVYHGALVGVVNLDEPRDARHLRRRGRRARAAARARDRRSSRRRRGCRSACSRR